MAVTIRKLDTVRDRETLARLDLSVSGKRFARAEVSGDQLSLWWVESEEPIERRIQVDLQETPWQTGWILEEDGCVRGFVCVGHIPWNARLVIYHFFVDRAHRGRGLGRVLLGRVLDMAKPLEAKTLWAETSNFNDAGIQAFQQLGFELCGLDTMLYRGTPREGEFGVSLAYLL